MLEYIAFYPETFAAIQRYEPADRCYLYEAMRDYVFSGEEPDWPGDDIKWYAWDQIRIKLDAAIRKSEAMSENGRRGGRPQKASESREKPEKANESREKPTKANESPKTKTETKTETETKTKTRDNARAGMFDRFWSAYPRKTAKPTAQTAFAKLNPDEQLLQVMLTAIEKQKASPQWTRDGGQFIPHPATWLNQRRWEDETPKASAGRTVPAQQYTQREYHEEDGIPDWVIQKGREMGILGGDTG